MAPYKRKTPEEILYSIYRLHRGRLKIIIGSVSGSGKTYHMLEEGKLLKKQGIDVVISAVSTMQRAETMQQLADLERVPSIHWLKDGKEQKDLPLETLLERNRGTACRWLGAPQPQRSPFSNAAGRYPLFDGQRH